jgi:hypothetical protein
MKRRKRGEIAELWVTPALRRRVSEKRVSELEGPPMPPTELAAEMFDEEQRGEMLPSVVENNEVSGNEGSGLPSLIISSTNAQPVKPGH